MVRQDLEDYCMKRIQSKKPEWQILAERHGWVKPEHKDKK